MSIRAINWVMQQRTDGPSAQIVLYVVADTANEHGVSLHADPDYIADHTRQSRATVFRRLDELERANALTRIIRHDGDGRRIYEIRLRLDQCVNYTSVADLAGDGVETQDIDGESQIETQRPESQIETGKVSPVRLGESHCCDSKSPSKNPEDSPNPPLGGGQETIDEEFEKDLAEFAASYPAPITDLPRLRTVMAGMVPTLRRKIVCAAKGYGNFITDCARRNKTRAVKDAHRWVGGGLWQGYVASGETVEKAQLVQHVAIDSAAGKALEILHQIAHISAPREFGRNYQLSRPLSAQALAFAQASPSAQWVFVSADNPNQCRAWTDLIASALAGKPRPVLVSVWPRNPNGQRGFMAPWPWPPRQDGSLSTGPPPTTTQDDNDFVKQNQGLG